jgi:hypothetical protein
MILNKLLLLLLLLLLLIMEADPFRTTRGLALGRGTRAPLVISLSLSFFVPPRVAGLN